MSHTSEARTRSIALLGSTGSIGTQALDVIRRNPGRFEVVALSAGGANLDTLVDQILEVRPSKVAVADESAGFLLSELLFRAMTGAQVAPWRGEILAGPEAATQVAGLGVDVVLNGITGSVGLEPTLSALDAGSTLALANKESLVVGGSLVTRAAKPGQIVPVDSEHSALAQALRSGTPSEVRKLVLTASGGPFRGWDEDQLATVTREQALNHPTWDMGPVVTINSATMMNKGLEVIEAHLLFDVPFDRIDVVVNPQSIIHSMVEFVDGSTIAQVSPPDMRLPIALGLSWPDRLEDAIPACDWTQASTWTFEPLDSQAFPSIDLARQAGSMAGTAPAVFNAANEECVAAFLSGKLAFNQIVPTVQKVLDTHLVNGEQGGVDVLNQAGSGFVPDGELTLHTVLTSETWARQEASKILT